MFNMNQVGRKIVTLRKENNMTQTELADKMGVSFQAVSNWERGNSMPDISKLPELAELFHISVDELLGEKSSLLNSAINHELKEYVEKNDVSREELEANIPILKPGQIEIIAENIDLTSGNRVEVFLPYLNAETVAALARKRVERGESAVSFLPFLEDEVLEELALLKEEKGESVIDFLPFLKEEALKRITLLRLKRGETVQDILPFLDAGFLGEIVLKSEQ